VFDGQSEASGGEGGPRRGFKDAKEATMGTCDPK